MFVNRVCLWTLPLLVALPAWSAAPGQMRLHVPSWDIGNLYSRLTGVFGGSHKKTQQTPRPETELDVDAINDYYNDYWENYYYNNPPYVEIIPVPRPPSRPRPSRRPRPRPTARPTTTRRPSSLTTAAPTPTITTEGLANPTDPAYPTPPNTEGPGNTENGTSPRPGTTGSPITISRDPYITSAALKPPLHLSIKTPPHSVSALCHFHPQLCDQPDEAHFVEVIDGNGQPLILIAPPRSARRPAHRATKLPFSLKTTRRYHSQRVYSNGSKSTYKISARAKASGKAARHRTVLRKTRRKGRH